MYFLHTLNWSDAQVNVSMLNTNTRTTEACTSWGYTYCCNGRTKPHHETIWVYSSKTKYNTHKRCQTKSKKIVQFFIQSTSDYVYERSRYFASPQKKLPLLALLIKYINPVNYCITQSNKIYVCISVKHKRKTSKIKRFLQEK